MDEPRLLTTREVAAYLRTGTETIRRYVRQGLLRPIRMNCSRYLFTQTEVKRLISERQVTNG